MPIKLRKMIIFLILFYYYKLITCLKARLEKWKANCNLSGYNIRIIERNI